MKQKIVKTLKLGLVAALAGFFSMNTAFAQDEDEITDEKLEAYIMVMDSVDVLRTQLSDTISALVVNHELMDNGKVFNAIKTAKGDTTKLAEEGITEEQMAAYEELQMKIEEKTLELNSSFSEMVKEHVGVGDYNRIRKGLRSDEELKERYEAIANALENAGEEGETLETADADEEGEER